MNKRNFTNGIEYRDDFDRLHRKDGPAIEWEDGRKEYWIEGKRVSENGFNFLKTLEQASSRVTRFTDEIPEEMLEEIKKGDKDFLTKMMVTSVESTLEEVYENVIELLRFKNE